ncbi:hypothetical protein XaFJ1_GM001319 [Xanthomonas albilineans]|nr:hypothetical protein XaFJ1_GM001319 [Xanthomonas albilineans]
MAAAPAVPLSLHRWRHQITWQAPVAWQDRLY